MARRPKLSKTEKIEQAIRLQLRRQERAVEMQTKAAKMLRTSAQALARLHKSQRRLEAKTASPKPTVLSNAKMIREVEYPPKPAAPTPIETLPVMPKPKRQRKPKPAANGGDFPQPTTEMQQERAKRMEAMGFRKTSKRKPVAEAGEK